jgi:molybdate transport system substrate-binding protein
MTLRHWTSRRLTALVLAAVLASPLAAAGKTELNVYAAASLSDAFNEIAQKLEQKRPGLAVRLNFAGSQQLVTQITISCPARARSSRGTGWS